MSDDNRESCETGPAPAHPPCPYCGGTGEVSGVVDDVVFMFQCRCSGGSEESFRWLLGQDSSEPSGGDWVV